MNRLNTSIFPSPCRMMQFLFDCSGINIDPSLRKLLQRNRVRYSYRKKSIEQLAVDVDRAFVGAIKELFGEIKNTDKGYMIINEYWSIVFEILHLDPEKETSFYEYCRRALCNKLARRCAHLVLDWWVGSDLNTEFPEDWFLPNIERNNSLKLPTAKVIDHFKNTMCSPFVYKQFICMKNGSRYKSFDRILRRWRYGLKLPKLASLSRMHLDAPSDFSTIKRHYRNRSDKDKMSFVRNCLADSNIPVTKGMINKWIRFLDSHVDNLGDFKFIHFKQAMFVARFSTSLYRAIEDRWGKKRALILLQTFTTFYREYKNRPKLQRAGLNIADNTFSRSIACLYKTITSTAKTI
jgi:hypothetical protein